LPSSQLFDISKAGVAGVVHRDQTPTTTQSLLQTRPRQQPEEEILQKLADISKRLDGDAGKPADTHSQVLAKLEEIKQQLALKEQLAKKQQLQMYPPGYKFPDYLCMISGGCTTDGSGKPIAPSYAKAAASGSATTQQLAQQQQHMEWARRIKERMNSVESKLDQLADLTAKVTDQKAAKSDNAVSEEELQQIVGQVARIESLVLRSKQAMKVNHHAASHPDANADMPTKQSLADKQFHVQSLMQVTGEKSPSTSALDAVKVHAGSDDVIVAASSPVTAYKAGDQATVSQVLPADVLRSPPADPVIPPAPPSAIVNPPVHVCHDEVTYIGAGGAKFRTDCAAWDAAGYCNKAHEHYSYVSTHCPQTCGLCNGCFDNRSTESCEKWRSWGYCSALTCGDNCRYTGFVQRHCRQSCMLCTPGQ
jgi:hypothetical protein